MHYVVLFSAKKHGIHTLDMVHAINNALRSLPNKESKLIIGPNRAGNLIEVGARFSEDSVLIYHAMKVQSRHIWRQS